MASAYSVEIVTDAARFVSLEPEWNALARNFAMPLGRYEWYDVCRRFIHSEFDPVLFVARDARGIRAIAPLVPEWDGPLKRLVPLNRHTREPCVFIYDDADALATVCRAIAEFAAPVALKHFYAVGPELTCLRDVVKRRGSTLYRKSDLDSSRVLLGIDRETLLSRMSSSSRTFMRRKRAIAERDGEVSFEVVTPDEATLGDYLEEIFRIEDSGWKRRAGIAMSSDPRSKQFSVEYFRTVAREGALRLFFLRVGETVVAFRIDVLHCNRLWEFKIGYDERFSKASPGILLMHETLGYACDEGLDAYEFLGYFEDWQSHWPIERYGFASLYYYPRTPSGLACFAVDCYDYARKRLGRSRMFRESRARTDGAQ